jgi:hypothetical protein
VIYAIGCKSRHTDLRSDGSCANVRFYEDLNS